MMKRNKGTLIVTILVILLPMVMGLLLWNKLPEQMPMHWNMEGEVDGWGSKAMLVVFLPLFMVGIQLICALTMLCSSETKGIKGNLLQLSLWICPCVSLLIYTLVYAKILGYDFAVGTIVSLALGLIFVVIGNLLPKCRRNHFIGIKLIWTLKSDENWNKTHRFAGKVWVLGGVIIASTAFLGNVFQPLISTIIMVAISTVYSYAYFRKYERKGR